MKHRIFSFAAGVIVAVLVIGLSITALAATGKLSIEVSTIDVLVDGEVFKPKDANGNNVMIFVYNGTTYAPLRALANAYGLEVGYDGEKGLATVSRPDYITPASSVPKLSEMSYEEFKSSLTLRMEHGEKLTEPYNVDIGGTKVAAPTVSFFYTFGESIDEAAFLLEWNNFKNADKYLDMLLSECANNAPYNSIVLSIEYNNNFIDPIARKSLPR